MKYWVKEISQVARIVFILGAGASRHAAAPLMADFIERAEELRPQIQDQYWLNAVNLVFKAINALPLIKFRFRKSLLTI